jgi:response regulator RpfG family c-di-GMP phosphodiesterase
LNEKTQRFFLLQHKEGAFEGSYENIDPSDWDLSSQQDQKVCCDAEHSSLLYYYKGHLLAFFHADVGASNQSELQDLLSLIQSNVEPHFQSVETNYEMVATQRSLVESLAEMAEAKSVQTGQHIKRIYKYMSIMCEELGLDRKTSDTISMASMLHDVGKLFIPREILDKPGALTPEEFDLVKTHVDEGQKLLHSCRGTIMRVGRVMAYEHHERWDGKGYLKMAGNEIDEYAAYLSVIDVFDALVSRRTYKEAWPPDEAYDEIVRGSGSQFSPQAVALFQKVYPRLLEVYHSYPDQSNIETLGKTDKDRQAGSRAALVGSSI